VHAYVDFSFLLLLSKLEETLELRPGVALVIQYKLTIAGVVPVSAAAPYEAAFTQLGGKAGLAGEHREVLTHLNSAWLDPSCVSLFF